MPGAFPWPGEGTGQALAATGYTSGMNRGGTVVVGLLGIALGVGLGWATSRSTPWERDREREQERKITDLEKAIEAASSRRASGATLEGTASASKPADGAHAGAPAGPGPSNPAADGAPTSAPPSAPAAKPAASHEPRFLLPGFEEGLKAVDWAAVGANMQEMAPAISRFAVEWAASGSLPADLVGRIQQLNGPLVTAALKVGGKFGIDNPNAAFTHPAFMLNAIAATLDAAGKPLSEEQARLLQKTAEDFTVREKARLSGYDDRTFALQKALDESALRDSFFSSAFDLLTPEQRDVLQPPATKGRLQADLFSSGLVWLTRSRLLPFSDRDGLAADMGRQVAGNLALPPGSDAAVHDALAEWAGALPREVAETPGDAMTMHGMVPVALVTDAAKREIAFLARLIDLGRFDEPTNRRIRGIDFVLVPVKGG